MLLLVNLLSVASVLDGALGVLIALKPVLVVLVSSGILFGVTQYTTLLDGAKDNTIRGLYVMTPALAQAVLHMLGVELPDTSHGMTPEVAETISGQLVGLLLFHIGQIRGKSSIRRRA